MKPMPFFCVALACVAFCRPAVGVSQAAGPGAVVTDSADVRIITSTGGDAICARVAGEPALTIGVVDGPDALMFQRIVSVARDGEGRLVVADAGWGEIRVFDAGGEHVLTIGREGEGPGEFQNLSGAWPGSGGNIFAVDGWQLRITEFGPVGEIESVTRIEGVEVPIFFRFWGPGGPGSILSSVTTLGARDLSHGEASRSSMEFRLHGLDGSVMKTVARLPGVAQGILRSNGDVLHMPVPFTLESSATGHAAGVAATTGETYELRLFDTAGKLSRIARLAETPPEWTLEHLEAGVPNERLRTLAQDFPLPATLPGYDRLAAADTGEIWARRYMLPRGATVHWDVFQPDGRYLGRVDVPAAFRLHGVSDGQLLGVHEDELGVQRVQVLDLRWGGAG
ncbi:MAG: hypothetical protein OXI76_12780 [Gemmatimonadota bacterium]|nr:hypothetical protein [Gemmatimonadota bacterium]